jgi:hypothetical protein
MGGALAAAGVLVLTLPAGAGDTQKLKLVDDPPARTSDVHNLKRVNDAPTRNLLDDGGGADTLDVGGHGSFHGGSHGGFHSSFHGGSHGGFHNSFHGGFHNGFHNSFHGGFHNGFHNSFHGGFHNGFHSGFRGGFHDRFRFNSFAFGFGFGRPWYYGSYYDPYYYSPYYYAPPVYYYSQPVYYVDPFYTLGGTSASTYSLSIAASPRPVTRELETLPPPMPPAGDDGTFPYDGGPRKPAPMPKADPAPTGTPTTPLPLDGRAVSLPAKPGKLAYPAYGETWPAPATGKGVIVKTDGGKTK